MSDATRILESIEQGDSKAADKLLPLVFDELRKPAASRMAQEPPNQTLQPSALVHEFRLRLVGDSNPNFSGRAHFFGAAAEAMRCILVVVKLCCFVGMTNVAAAQALDLSERTAKYYWTHARAGLIHEMSARRTTW